MTLNADEIAQMLGADSWNSFLRRAEAGEIITAPRGALKQVGDSWDELRVESDLVQVRRGQDFVIGRRHSFNEEQLAPDLTFAGIPNAYDDASFPIACPRSLENSERNMEALRRGSAELRGVRWQIALVLLIGGLFCLGASIWLAAIPLISLLLLGVGLWTVGVAWVQAGDLVADTHASQPWWSFRRSRLSNLFPVDWFGPKRHK